MVCGMPDRGDETVPQLAPGVAGRAVRHSNQLSVIDRRFVVGIISWIRPDWRIVRRACGSDRKQAANDHTREQRGNYLHSIPRRLSRRAPLLFFKVRATRSTVFAIRINIGILTLRSESNAHELGWPALSPADPAAYCLSQGRGLKPHPKPGA